MKKWILFGAIGILLGSLIFFLIKPLGLMQANLKIREKINILISDSIGLDATIKEQALINVINKLEADVSVNKPLDIMLDDNFDVPLTMNLDVPLANDLFLNDTLDLKFNLPIDVDLSPNELALSDLVIPFNKKLYIKDQLPVKFTIPLDTKIKTNWKAFPNIRLPIKAEVPVDVVIPIDQQLNVIDTLVLNPVDYKVKFKTIIPVNAKVPVRQNIFVKGQLAVPVDQTVNIPLKKKTSVPVLSKIDGSIDIKNNLDVGFRSPIILNAKANDSLNVYLGNLPIKPNSISIGKKKNKEVPN